jgi:alpha/beta superfamily hydrolase
LRAGTRREFVAGPAGRIECAVDAPESSGKGAPRGAALIAHPHPLFGGTLDNKVAQTLAKSFVDLGYEAWRPNFRGVGETEGKHDQGRGEVDDLEAVYQHMKKQPVVLAGFSFGAAMQAALAQRVASEWVVLVGVAVLGREVPPVPAGTLVIHGEVDTTIPLAAVLDWARPQNLKVAVVPGADHFFHRKLQELRDLVKANWQSA